LYQLGAHGPKWMTYGDVSNGIHVGTGSKAVLVEDAASACSIARLKDYTGVALLGTNITSNIKSALLIYKLIYILLDNDASGKAAQMTKQLRGDVFLRTTSKDPKELRERQLQRILTNKLASDQTDIGEKNGCEENERHNSFRF
jgi:DNA primase